ncbi:MAG: hypothetical protein BWY31_04784 [Lentisphaerae bacterium ADurb.Bin242]|nr:MAG: hypothetical protein BWY31_04784 [Lentisphaerae bacterium ADurb.Bin242]
MWIYHDAELIARILPEQSGHFRDHRKAGGDGGNCFPCRSHLFRRQEKIAERKRLQLNHISAGNVSFCNLMSQVVGEAIIDRIFRIPLQLRLKFYRFTRFKHLQIGIAGEGESVFTELKVSEFRFAVSGCGDVEIGAAAVGRKRERNDDFPPFSGSRIPIPRRILPDSLARVVGGLPVGDAAICSIPVPFDLEIDGVFSAAFERQLELDQHHFRTSGIGIESEYSLFCVNGGTVRFAGWEIRFYPGVP